MFPLLALNISLAAGFFSCSFTFISQIEFVTVDEMSFGTPLRIGGSKSNQQSVLMRFLNGLNYKIDCVK